MPKQEKSGFINFASQAIETLSVKIMLVGMQTVTDSRKITVSFRAN